MKPLVILILFTFHFAFSQISSADQSQILQLHNSARAAVGLGSLTWDSAAAVTAQNWANLCQYGHNPDRTSQYIANGGTNLGAIDAVGENVAAGTTPSTSGGLTQAWINEVNSWNCLSNTCSIQDCGHYTQIVWDTTTAVGCGKTSCTTNSPFGSNYPNWDFLVCVYSPAGNIENFNGVVMNPFPVQNCPGANNQPAVTTNPANNPPATTNAANNQPATTNAANNQPATTNAANQPTMTNQPANNPTATNSPHSQQAAQTGSNAGGAGVNGNLAQNTNGPSAGTIAGSVLGVIFGLALVAALVIGALFLIRRRQAKSAAAAIEITAPPGTSYTSTSSRRALISPTYSPSPSNRNLGETVNPNSNPSSQPTVVKPTVAKPLPSLPSMLPVGTQVMAKYSGDGKEYRAIINQSRNGEYLVKYVDFGDDKEWLPASSVRKM